MAIWFNMQYIYKILFHIYIYARFLFDAQSQCADSISSCQSFWNVTWTVWDDESSRHRIQWYTWKILELPFVITVCDNGSCVAWFTICFYLFEFNWCCVNISDIFISVQYALVLLQLKPWGHCSSSAKKNHVAFVSQLWRTEHSS